jgi:predicted phage terminase large subunit-like protein
MMDQRRFAAAYLRDRQRARTDLGFFCREILDFHDIRDAVHGPIIAGLQHFHGHDEHIDVETLRIVQGDPAVPLWDLEGPRNHLLLYPRGALKSSINCIAHTIQWILNYPDVRILITTATEKLAKQFMVAVKSAFVFNRRFRFLFPEFCPSNDREFGNSEQFRVPNARPDPLGIGGPTVTIATVGSSVAGQHPEVIKHSDVIETYNSKTQGGLESTREHFQMCLPVLESGTNSRGESVRGFRTVEGTIYSYADYHAELLERLTRKPDPTWTVTHHSCWANAEKTASYWPERYSIEVLNQLKEELGPELFANQYELNPIAEGAGLTTVERLERLFMPRKRILELLPRLRLHVTIDLAGLDAQSTGDYTVLTLAGFDRTGRMYVIECHRGHFEGEDVVRMMFDLDSRYRITDFKIEKDAHARGLRSTLDREQSIRGRYLALTYIPRDTHVTKKDRIKYGLRYWFTEGIIRFAEDLDVRDALTDEVLRFPKWKHDDILDTLVDQTQNQDSTEPDVMATPKAELPTPFRPPHFRGFDTQGEPIWNDASSDVSASYDAFTGI